MNSSKIVKLLAVIVIFVGTMVMLGWFLDIPILKSILPNWVTMKFSTALCFVLSGIILYFSAETNKGPNSFIQVVLPVPCFVITLIMVGLLTSVFWGVKTGIEDLFVKEKNMAILTTTPGRPSIGTMLCFLAVVSGGFLTMLKSKNRAGQYFLLGIMISVMGGLAVVGYVINMPVLYYNLEGISTAMALHTAILFLLIGIGMVIIGKADKE